MGKVKLIVLFDTFSNADDWVEMSLCAEPYQNYLRKYIELKNGLPSHDTICHMQIMYWQ